MSEKEAKILPVIKKCLLISDNPEFLANISRHTKDVINGAINESNDKDEFLAKMTTHVGFTDKLVHGLQAYSFDTIGSGKRLSYIDCDTLLDSVRGNVIKYFTNDDFVSIGERYVKCTRDKENALRYHFCHLTTQLYFYTDFLCNFNNRLTLQEVEVLYSDCNLSMLMLKGGVIGCAEGAMSTIKSKLGI